MAYGLSRKSGSSALFAPPLIAVSNGLRKTRGHRHAERACDPVFFVRVGQTDLPAAVCDEVGARRMKRGPRFALTAAAPHGRMPACLQLSPHPLGNVPHQPLLVAHGGIIPGLGGL